jgi:ATP-dependent DNA helicase PIF1
VCIVVGILSLSLSLSHKLKETKNMASAKRVHTTFSDAQVKAIDLAQTGTSFFLTGAAGTGKSHVLHEIVEVLEDACRKRVAITASTGTSAEHIGGVTLHSFTGIGIGDGDVEELVEKVRKWAPAVRAWRSTDVLVIDEISMISGTLFTKLDYVGRAIRNRLDVPFGGLQIIAIGDFYQLPPVPGRFEPPPSFAFESPSWVEVFGKNVVQLEQVYRQTDPVFLKGLHEIRCGHLDPEFARVIKETCSKKEDTEEGEAEQIVPTRLFSLNREVDTINQRELAALPDPAYTFKATDYFTDAKYGPLFPVDGEITLKRGAQVVFLKNALDFRNGTRGVVVGFGGGKSAEENHGKEVSPIMIKVRTMTGKIIDTSPLVFEIRQHKKVVACRRAMPLKLAYGLSIHKSQGMTIDCLEVDLRSVFSPAQAYTALSRASSMEGLRVIGLSSNVVYCNHKVLQYYASLSDDATTE